MILLVILLLASCARDEAAPGTLSGDVGTAEPAPTRLSGDVRTHDPGMIRQEDTYYVFSTGDEHGLNQGNIQIRKSTDLAYWQLVGTVFETTPAWISEALGTIPPNLWAPDISYFNGKYHLYYAGSRFGSNNSVIGLATNATLDPASPDYKWVEEGMVIRSRPSNNWNAIDPSLSFDAEGGPWLAMGSFWSGIKMHRIDSKTGKLASEDTKLYSLASRGGGPIEAPSIVYRDGYYYLFVSFDLCCRGVNSTYKIVVGRAKDITGPYTDHSGKGMDQGGGDVILAGDERFRGPGGQSVYLDGSTCRLVYHVYDAAKNGMPQLKIQDLTWTSDGWTELRKP